MKLSFRATLYLMLLSLILVLLSTVISIASFTDSYDHAEIAENRWMVALNGKYLGQSSSEDIMSDFSISLNKGDVMAISTVMPDLGHIDFPTLFLQSRYCAFNIYLDGDFYKAYNMADFRSNRFIGRNTYMISLPESYEGKLLRVEVFTAKNGIRETITHTSLGDYADLEGAYIRRYLTPFLIGSAMIVLGIIMMLLSMVLTPFRHEVAFNLFSGGLFSTVGLGLHSYYGLTSLYASISHETEMFEALLLLFIPLILIYIGILHPPKHKIIYRIVIGITLANFILRVVLHYKKILYLGFTKDLELVQWVSSLRFSENLWMLILSSLATYLLLSGLYRFFIATSSSVDQSSEYGRLTQVAYEDPLTGLLNRAGLNDQFDIYERESKDYYIIHFDVNDLKTTNDTYGHQTGDELLKCFARGISSVFGRFGVCSRQGGDEFTVLLRIRNDEAIKGLFEKLDERLDSESKKAALPIKVRAAHGYSYRANFATIHEASMAADQHMYECKHRMKS